MSKPSRKRHPQPGPPFERRFRYLKVDGVYGRRIDTVSHDAPLTPHERWIWRWMVLGVVALGFLGLILLGR